MPPNLVFPELKGLPIPLLENWDSSRGPLMVQEVIFQYLNAITAGVETPTLVVLDDLHLVSEVPEIAHMLDRLIGLAPPSLHFIVSTRHVLQLPNLFRWRSLGQVYALDQSLLIFSEEEIEALFREHYNLDLSPEEIEDLYAVTEGWAISLQLIGQSLNSGTKTSVKEALALRESPLDSLFEVLAKDVLEGQTVEMQTFMRSSAVLRTMIPASCDWLLDSVDSKEKLAFLQNNDLFVASLGEHELRYHPIFQQFLYQQLDSEERAALHRRAAEYYQEHEEPNSAIYHFLSADDYFSAAKLLNTYGGQLHAMGHLDTLANYLGHLSPEALSQFPTLIFYMGDLARLHSRFQEALGWYQQAEGLWRERGQIDGISRALRGQARIYLDTVNPRKAEELLQEALRLSDRIADRQTSARLYQLLAENKLNAGKVEEAEKLRAQAEILRQEGPDDSHLWYRVLLRTGRLEEARQQVEFRAKEESAEPFNLPRSHRETQLLLSIIYAMQGDAEAAMASAEEGIRRGKELASPFITAVGYMRQGNALLLQSGYQSYDQAEDLFNQVIEISEELSTPTFTRGSILGAGAELMAIREILKKLKKWPRKGYGIAVQAGDEWIASLTRLALGGSYLLSGKFSLGFEWLDKALRGFQECSDTFGISAARLWQCFGWFQQGQFEVLGPAIQDLLTVCQQNSYEYLFTKISMLGLPDDRLIVPLLLWATRE